MVGDAIDPRFHFPLKGYADLQGLISLLANGGGSGGGTLTAVPEPSGVVLAGIATTKNRPGSRTPSHGWFNPLSTTCHRLRAAGARSGERRAIKNESPRWPAARN